jgi:TetR/AcrR family transcriptional regulator
LIKTLDEKLTTSDLDTRDRILDAAKGVFLERGTSGARMQEIADTAGVNKALIHYYFRNKDTLADAVFHRELRALVQPVFHTLASELPLEEKVEATVGLYLDHLSAFPQMPGYVLADMHFHPGRLEEFFEAMTDVAPGPMGQRVFTALGRQIDEAVAQGRMRPLTPRQFMVNLVSLCVFPFAARPLLTLVMGGDDEFQTMIDERRTTLTEFFLGALRP